MRTGKTTTVSLPPEMLEQAQELARRENRTMSELVREALRRYAQAPAASVTFAEAVARIQQESLAKGLDKLTKREIDEEIAAARRENAP